VDIDLAGGPRLGRAALCELRGLQSHPTHPEGTAGIHLAGQRGRAAVVRGDGQRARDLCRAGIRVRSAERVGVRNRPLLEGVGDVTDSPITGHLMFFGCAKSCPLVIKTLTCPVEVTEAVIGGS